MQRLSSFIELTCLIVFNHSTGNDLRLRTLGSMEALRDFVGGVVEHLPSRLGEDEDSGGIMNSDTFTEPSRKRFRSGNSGTGPQRGNLSIDQQIAFWSTITVCIDVSNLRDLGCFNVQSVLTL